MIEIIRHLPQETVLALTYDWEFWARPEQLEPSLPWAIWVILTGRGFGKTRTGAETLRKHVKQGRAKAIALIAPTAADVRDTMLGMKPGSESGLLQVHAPWERPLYRPSYRELSWQTRDGDTYAAATMFSGEEPDRLRGPQHDMGWWDEPAATPHQDDVESNLMFGLRLGESKLIVTGTPLPKPLIKRWVKDAKANNLGGTYLTTGTLYDNPFLSQQMRDFVIRKYDGTRLGRQEIYGHILDDNPNALWTQEMIDADRMDPLVFAQKVRDGLIVLRHSSVAVDPAVTSTKSSDETGIMAGYLDDQRPPHLWVVEDATVQGVRPAGWAAAAIRVYKARQADVMVGEVNNGGDMVEDTVLTQDSSINFRTVRATRGKILRAEPVSALYEKHRVHHVGVFQELEDQMCEYDGDPTQASPDRLDALVWLATHEIIDQENSAEEAIAYLERRSIKCAPAAFVVADQSGSAGCGTLNYAPPGVQALLCRSCSRALKGATAHVDLASTVEVVA